MKRYLFLITILSVIFFISDTALCAYHFVRPGPNGGYYGREDGTDWDNAYDGFPSSLIRGDTYYIAGGVYDMNSYEFDDAESGTNRIIIKKANATDCSGIAGWNSSFASTVAEFYNSSEPTYNRALYLKKGYYTFDGVTGSGQSGYGFKVRIPSDVADRNRLFLVDMAQAEADDCIFKYIEFQGYTLTRAKQDQLNDQAFIFKISSSSDSGTIQYCYIHDFTQGIYISGDAADSWIIEHNYIENCWGGGPSSSHAETINLIDSDNHIIRYNTFYDDPAAGSITGQIVVHGQLMQGYGSVDGVEIYDNVFINHPGGLWLGTASSACSVEMNNWKVYNNTIVDGVSKIYVPQRTGCTGAYSDQNGTWPASGYEVINNLFYGGSGDPTETGVIYDHNYYNNMAHESAIPDNAINSVISTESVSTLFQDYASKDFRLGNSSQAIDVGTDLDEPYNRDIVGMPRSKGSTTDIGAYELFPAPSVKIAP